MIYSKDKLPKILFKFAFLMTPEAHARGWRALRLLGSHWKFQKLASNDCIYAVNSCTQNKYSDEPCWKTSSS